jgi:DNA-binding PucR family transcriptional regulator
VRPAAAERLAETLRSWLLHQGRRDAVAEELHVHAQTVRYRMGQLRELYGDRLDDPRTVLELVLALHGRPSPPAPAPGDRSSGPGTPT